jgi:hypothetical protein
LVVEAVGIKLNGSCKNGSKELLVASGGGSGGGAAAAAGGEKSPRIADKSGFIPRLNLKSTSTV